MPRSFPNSDLDVNILTLLFRKLPEKALRELDLRLQRTRYGSTGLQEGRITTGSGDNNYTLQSTEYGKRTIEIQAAFSGNHFIFFPNIDSAWWFLSNLTTGGFSLIARMVGQASGGVTVPPGETRIVFCDGTNIKAGNG